MKKNKPRAARPPEAKRKIRAAQFAKLLGISPQNLNHHQKNADAPALPKTAAEVQIAVRKWLEFLAIFGRIGSATAEDKRKFNAARLAYIEEQTRRLKLDNDAKVGGGELIARGVVEKLLQSFGRALAIAVPAATAAASPNFAGISEARDVASVLGKVGCATCEGVVGYAVGTSSEWPNWMTEQVQRGFDGRDEPWPEKRVEALKSLVEFFCSEAGAQARADLENERRAWTEKRAGDWDNFTRFRHDIDGEKRRRREAWLAIAASGRTPVPDATDEELAQFPGLRRAA